MTLGNSSRQGKPVIWIAVHTAEGSRTKESLFNYFDSSQSGSSHAGIDAAGIGVWLPDSVGAWTMLGGNPYAVQAELCGFAKWTRAQWLSSDAQDGCANPRQMLRNTSRWIADVAKRNGIPIVRLADDQIRGRSAKGVLGHGDYSRATGDGDHTDPGPNFPWDVVLNDALAYLNNEGEDDMFNDTDRANLDRLNAFLTITDRSPVNPATGKRETLFDTAYGTQALVRAQDAKFAAVLSAIADIPTTTGPDGSPVAKLEDVTEAVKNVFRQVRMGFPVDNPGTGG
jgi:hypothetical protein